MFRVLALDFDGVISDSSPEAFVVALRTYIAMRPGGSLAAEVSMGDGVPARTGVLEHPLYGGFLEAMPLGNRAEDFGVTLAALEAGRPLVVQADQDRVAAELGPDWMQSYHERFYDTRAALRATDRDAWLALMSPYRPFVELLRRRAADTKLAIATAKDRISVRLLLETYGIDDLFPESAVLDKETGRNKRAHLERLRVAHDCAFSEIVFIDDKVNHLDAVASLGVRCGLASWGFNGEREIRLALRSGHRVYGLSDVEQQLFGN